MIHGAVFPKLFVAETHLGPPLSAAARVTRNPWKCHRQTDTCACLPPVVAIAPCTMIVSDLTVLRLQMLAQERRINTQTLVYLELDLEKATDEVYLNLPTNSIIASGELILSCFGPRKK